MQFSFSLLWLFNKICLPRFSMEVYIYVRIFCLCMLEGQDSLAFVIRKPQKSRLNHIDILWHTAFVKHQSGFDLEQCYSPAWRSVLVVKKWLAWKIVCLNAPQQGHHVRQSIITNLENSQTCSEFHPYYFQARFVGRGDEVSPNKTMLFLISWFCGVRNAVTFGWVLDQNSDS